MIRIESHYSIESIDSEWTEAHDYILLVFRLQQRQKPNKIARQTTRFLIGAVV